jgi:hypothetical protein
MIVNCGSVARGPQVLVLSPRRKERVPFLLGFAEEGAAQLIAAEAAVLGHVCHPLRGDVRLELRDCHQEREHQLPRRL